MDERELFMLDPYITDVFVDIWAVLWV